MLADISQIPQKNNNNQAFTSRQLDCLNWSHIQT